MSKIQEFASTQASFDTHFDHDRHSSHRRTFKSQRDAALEEWRQLLAGEGRHARRCWKRVRITLTAPTERLEKLFEMYTNMTTKVSA